MSTSTDKYVATTADQCASDVIVIPFLYQEDAIDVAEDLNNGDSAIGWSTLRADECGADDWVVVRESGLKRSGGAS